VVFGCGGERDIGKRAKMGAIANRYADKIVLTNDNPRGEPPQAIVAHIERGIMGDFSVELDRRVAIRHAVLSAAPEDLVLIAGKGHEDYQQIADHRLPFSDQVQARLALRDRGSGAT
jgi:UDP-N-acetylmuramoyl-L-alanyl-D-glutamate--2,6-diaminopimelate ligase